MMIELLIVSSIVVFFGLPGLLVLCACIVGTRADHSAKGAPAHWAPVETVNRRCNSILPGQSQKDLAG